MRDQNAPLDVLCAGEALWDLFAPKGTPFARARDLRLVPGGAAVNVALHLAALGLRAGLAATVGDDALGQALVERVGALGVDVTRVTTTPARTGLCVVERAGEERRVMCYRAPGEQAASLDRLPEAAALLLTGLLPDEAALAAQARAARRARRHRCTVVLDVNARPRMWRGKDPRIADAILHEADLVRASTDDLQVLGLDLERAREKLRKHAVLVVSDGPGPVVALGPFGRIERSPKPLRLVDPTGAGDALTAGILAEVHGAGRDGLRSGGIWANALDQGLALARAHLKKH